MSKTAAPVRNMVAAHIRLSQIGGGLGAVSACLVGSVKDQANVSCFAREVELGASGGSPFGTVERAPFRSSESADTQSVQDCGSISGLSASTLPPVCA